MASRIALQIDLRLANIGAAVRLMRLRQVESGAVFGDVVENPDVAAVVPGAAEMPGENPAAIGRVGDAALAVEPVKRADVVARNRPPVRIAGGGRYPALDPREQTLGARPIAP